jgi:sulfur-oxidizing protein SoxX
MAQYKVVDATIPQSLTGKAGNVEAGRKAAIDRKKGNCLACHAIPEIAEQPFHGEVGPALDDIGARSTAAEMRMRLVDPKAINDATIMPSFYKVGTHNVLKKWVGKTMLSAQEVEDIVAYLMTLNGVDQKKLDVLDKPAVQ